MHDGVKTAQTEGAGQVDGAQGAEGTETRYQRGLRVLSQVDGTAGEQVVAKLAEFAPDFARLLVEFPFGDVYARPQLGLREREIATIAALTAMGTARPQLEVHIAAGLHVGLTREEILEVIMQMAVYAGFPAALNGIAAAREVFRRQDAAQGGA
ncbi:carboxymuconolactone decarboxylase family protein [Nitratidesulfovibrio sp.]|uniref:carboxymuconolactone decarboxylase family protein n=1 Tax=Nitratidesulfovibrio sp. TaxID=2802297 RepID=UPI00333E28A6